MPSAFYSSVRSMLTSRPSTISGSQASRSGVTGKSSRTGPSMGPYNTVDNQVINKTVQYSVEQQSRASDEVELTGVKTKQIF